MNAEALTHQANAVKQQLESNRLQERGIAIQTLDSLFKDLRQFDVATENYGPEFYNTLEYLAFIINENVTESKHAYKFFRHGIVYWYEAKILGDVRMPQQFAELTKLYNRIKSEGLGTGELPSQ